MLTRPPLVRVSLCLCARDQVVNGSGASPALRYRALGGVLPSPPMARAVGGEVAPVGADPAVVESKRPGSLRGSLGVAVVLAVVVAAAALRPVVEDLLAHRAVAHWATLFAAIAIAAMPFLVLGVCVSAAIAAFVPPDFLPKLLPERPALAVPVATAAGAALPGCECGSVPIAGRLVNRGVVPAAALTFLLAAPPPRRACLETRPRSRR